MTSASWYQRNYNRSWRSLQQLPALINARYTFRHATSMHWTARVWGHPRVHNAGEMMIGKHVRIVCDVLRSEFVTGQGGRLEIGDYSYINNGASVGAHQLIRIGQHCMIGPQLIMMDNDFHHVEVEHRLDVPESRPIIIGDHVWIGARVIILKGVSIGDYAVIAAGSVVTRDVPAYTVVAGVPASVVKKVPSSELSPHRRVQSSNAAI